MKYLDFVNLAKFRDLFTRELGWRLPRNLPPTFVSEVRRGSESYKFCLDAIAEFAGISVWELSEVPDRYLRRQIAKSVTRAFPDSLLIFHDSDEQVWVWPENQSKPGQDVRLSAQRHSTKDNQNNSLSTRIKLLDVRAMGPRASGTALLVGLKGAFDSDAEAASAIADLHDALVEKNGAKTELEVFLTRLLFLLFGDDSDLFESHGELHRRLLTLPGDGSLTRAYFKGVMAALNVRAEDRVDDDEYSAFPYVNGGLFSGTINCPEFDETSHNALLAASKLDWAQLSPAIFGAMFQGVLEVLEAHILDPTSSFKASREQLGAHYTSEANIHKVIDPLFMEDLRNRFIEHQGDAEQLSKLHGELNTLTFLDPACGCGNFLVVTYRELRYLEHDILDRLLELNAPGFSRADLGEKIRVDVDQFFGIEIVESAAQIAKVALWITDHQMNREAFDRFGQTRQTIPLRSLPQIVRADALTHAWDDVLPSAYCSYVIGNPPFLGSKRNDQKLALKAALSNLSSDAVRAAGELDLVSGWFALGARYMKRQGLDQVQLDLEMGVLEHEKVWWTDVKTSMPVRLRYERVTRMALVSTNSISQGEQVGILWPHLFAQGLEITFAYKSFKWTNDAPGMAAVHCVIIGMHLTKNFNPLERRIYANEFQFEIAFNIGPYLIDSDNTAVTPRAKPLSIAPEMAFGNQPIDDGLLQVEESDFETLNGNERQLVQRFTKNYVGARELLAGGERKILWLPYEEQREWEKSRFINERLDAVQAFRLKSVRKDTRHLRRGSWGFTTDQGRAYLAIPAVSSEARQYVPIAFLQDDTIASNALLVVPNASPWHFAVLTSKMHNTWIRIVSGRLESRLRYSASVTYNTFPWPAELNDASLAQLDQAGANILEIRVARGETLAAMYKNLNVASDLGRAHVDNDQLVDKLYGYEGLDDDGARFAFLMELYRQNLKMNAG